MGFRFKVDENLPVQCVGYLLALLPEESPVGRLWVVERDKVRIRE